ncbi:uncharacterized protein [Panulirus ornatus]|uniref:uncharacterized protein n=1 Tax=Panulirus ornatus TaxID=150431 RepID=UPI003A87B94D
MANANGCSCFTTVPQGALLVSCDVCASGTGSRPYSIVDMNAAVGQMVGTEENPQAGTWVGPSQVARAHVRGVGHDLSGPGARPKQLEVGQDLIFIVDGQRRVESELPIVVGNGAGGQVDLGSQKSASLLDEPVLQSSAMAFVSAGDGQHGISKLTCDTVLPTDVPTVNSELGWGGEKLVTNALCLTEDLGSDAGEQGDFNYFTQVLLQNQPGRHCPGYAGLSWPCTSISVKQDADATPTAVHTGQEQSESSSPSAGPKRKQKLWQLEEQTDPIMEAKRKRAKKAREQREREAMMLSNIRQEVSDVQSQVDALKEEKITLKSKISVMEDLIKVFCTKEPIINK